MKERLKKVIAIGITFLMGLITTTIWNMGNMPIEKLEGFELPSPPSIYTTEEEILTVLNLLYPSFIKKDGVVEIKPSISEKEVEQKLVSIAKRLGYSAKIIL